MSFYFYKFFLVFYSWKFVKFVEEVSKEDEDFCEICFENFFGGIWVFEFVVKFCYGVKVEFIFSNIVVFCCVVEFLEMIEDFGVESLIEKLDDFF